MKHYSTLRKGNLYKTENKQWKPSSSITGSSWTLPFSYHKLIGDPSHSHTSTEISISCPRKKGWNKEDGKKTNEPAI